MLLWNVHLISEISACDAGHLLESTNRFVHARSGATSNTFCRSFEVFLSTRLLEWRLKHWIDDAMVTVDFHKLF